MDITECKDLKDLYRKLGGFVYCANSTTGSTQEYHVDKTNKCLAMIADVRPIIVKPDFTAKHFKALLYKHFPDEVLSFLPYILKLNHTEIVYQPVKFERQLKSGLKKWLADEV